MYYSSLFAQQPDKTDSVPSSGDVLASHGLLPTFIQPSKHKPNITFPGAIP